MYCGVIKEHADRSYVLRHRFMKMYTLFEELEEVTWENMAERKKDLLTAMKDFIKFY